MSKSTVKNTLQRLKIRKILQRLKRNSRYWFQVGMKLFKDRDTSVQVSAVLKLKLTVSLMQLVVAEIWHLCTKIKIRKKDFYYFRLSTSLRSSLKLQLWLRQPSISKMTSTPTLMQITTPLQSGLRSELASTLFLYHLLSVKFDFVFKAKNVQETILHIKISFILSAQGAKSSTYQDAKIRSDWVLFSILTWGYPRSMLGSLAKHIAQNRNKSCW